MFELILSVVLILLGVYFIYVKRSKPGVVSKTPDTVTESSKDKKEDKTKVVV